MRSINVFLLCVLIGMSACFGQEMTEQEIVEVDSTQSSVSEYPSLLWEIDREDLQQSSYLYGTIHMIPKDSFFLTPSVEEKLSSSQQLVLEIPLDMNVGSMFSSMMWMLIPKGKSLKDYVSDEDYSMVRAFMEDSMTTRIPMYHKIKPLIVSQQISTMYCSGEEMESYEMVFSQRFKDMKRPISGLETMKDQMKALDNISIEEQADGLVEMIKSPQEACEQMSEMVRMYRAQDLVGLMQMTQESEELDEHLVELLDARNERWIPQIEELIQKEQIFIAVGAGHLAGDMGVIQLLRDQGYSVRPIIDQANSNQAD